MIATVVNEPTVLERGTQKYIENLSRFFNKDKATRLPAEVHVVRSSKDVISALQRAKGIGAKVGVRSGGHLVSKPSLIQDGVLIDTSHLNREVIYDPQTTLVSFGPSVRVYEAWEATDAVGRFFPFGHAPDVALGGFCLAGGQGFFMRGWGATITDWIVKLEIVVPDGRVVTASKDENEDLFWAARGSGQAFFGVVTRFWSRTIPAKKLFGRSITFIVGDRFEDLLSFAFDRNENMPKAFTEAAVAIMHPELFDTSSADESVPSSSPLLLAVHASAYAETLSEASKMLDIWDVIPDSLKGCLIEQKPVAETNWEDFFQLQHQLNPQTPNQKWGIHSILSDPSVSRSSLLEAIKPALCNLPTRSSYGCVYMCDVVNPDEKDAVFSLPQKYYISTFSGWKNPALKSGIMETMTRSYEKAASVACGMYVADFDQSSESPHSPYIRVWTDSARDNFMKIREKWDPSGLLPGYKAFEGQSREKPHL